MPHLFQRQPPDPRPVAAVDDPIASAQRQRRVIIRGVRMAFFILITTVALVSVIQRGAERALNSGTVPQDGTLNEIWWVPVVIGLVLFGLVLLVDLATPRKKIASITGVIFGLLAGVLATVAISAVIELAIQVWLPPEAIKAINPIITLIKPLVGIALCYLGITTVLQTQDDFRLVIPYVEFAKQIRGARPLILDTSALIDARIADVAATGLIQAPLVVPRFVIAELQLLSDSQDKLKRARGRRGLDIVARLQRQGTIDLTIDESPTVSRAVDQMLVELAQHSGARIVTTDLGLTRVAQIQGIIVLNMHEVANALRPALIPGESLSLRLVKAGEHAGQGVGYLDDGTMVVVENGGPFIGQSQISVLVSSTLQTSAGRMVFAKVTEDEGGRESAATVRVPEAAAALPAPQPAAPLAPPLMQAARAAETSEGSGAETAEPENPEPLGDAPAPPAASPTAASSGTGPSGPAFPKPPARRMPSARNPRR